MKNRIKKLELDKNLEIEMLEKQLADWKKFNDQLQTTCQKKDIEVKDLLSDLQEYQNWVNQLDAKNDVLQNFVRKLKNMNLFQLILWWMKK